MFDHWLGKLTIHAIPYDNPIIMSAATFMALVTLLAVAAHVLVAGAVKRYTRYVDSGTEYKQLLKSIKTIDDLEDGERLEQLKQHPELREFLLGFKTRMAARERQMKEGERRPAASRMASGSTGPAPPREACSATASSRMPRARRASPSQAPATARRASGATATPLRPRPRSGSARARASTPRTLVRRV